MNRRSIFKLFAGAVMASAMEICGWTIPKPKVVTKTYMDLLFEAEAKNLQGVIDVVGRTGRMSQLMHKGTMPEGMGYNYNTIT